MARPSWWCRVKQSVSRGGARASDTLSRCRVIRPGVERLEERTLLASGDLDPTFGIGGKVLTDFAGIANAQPFAVAVQLDSKIVVAGTGSSQSLLARYLPNGSLDPTFGNNGRIIYAAGFNRGLALQADGKTVVAGSRNVSPTEIAFVVARFNLDGSPDSTFGSGATVTTLFGPGTQAMLSALTLQADGKIVAAGHLSAGGAVLARYSPDGSLDATFDGDGRATAPMPRVGSLLVQPDGRIVVAGTTNLDLGDAVLARLLPNGSPDSTFTSSPQAIKPPVPFWDRASGGTVGGAALQSDGRIVVAASARTQSFFNPRRPGIVMTQIMLFRFEPSGRLDSTFGTAGNVVTAISTGDAPGIVVTDDGRIVTGGGGSGNFQVARYRANGSLDTSFGNTHFGSGGKVLTYFDGQAIVIAVTLQPDGKIVAVGPYSNIQENRRGFALARYIGGFHPNELFVIQVYRDLLRRSPEREGLELWTGLLDRGMSRGEVVFRIQASPEYHGLVVRDLYSRVLGRQTDPIGLPFWTEFLNRGGTTEQLRVILFSSDEYFQRRAGGTNPGFVAALYRDALFRPPEPAAAQGWGELLAAGVSRATVAEGVVGSREFDWWVVRGFYLLWLRRDPDPAGHDALVGHLQRGVTDDEVLAVILASPEYFSRM